jgi:hypothetical protein
MRPLVRVAALSLLISTPLPLAAQEMAAPKKHENSSWLMMVNVKFKPGKIEDAMKIINEHFAPAGMAIGMTDVRVLHHVGGAWDLTLMFPMPEGPRQLEWAVTPQDAKWMAEMAKREKGMANAMALLNRYADMLAREETTIVREQR